MSAQNGSLSPTSTASTASTASSQIDHLKDGVKHLVEQGQEKAGQVKDALVGAKDKVLTTGSSFLSSARNLISDNPFAAVGIAFGVGYVAMRIFRR